MGYVTNLIINDFNMNKIDWMGYRLNKNEMFSYHHIDKKENGGLVTYNNGAILCPNSSHPYLHLIEYKDYDIYLYINAILKVINTQRTMSSINQLKAIDEVLKVFEKEHCDEKNKKGKKFIKEIYLKRGNYYDN